MSGWGFVYCMSNPCMPGVFKIGMTTRSPMQRRNELSDSTSSPMPFTLLCYGEVEDPRQVELTLHDMFGADRVSPAREFFRSSFEAIQTAIKEYCYHFCMSDDGQVLLDEILEAGAGGKGLRLVGGMEGRA